ncbi:DUF2269 family protein [Microbacterium protaetiae]|uniref:DUF2269 family protein n=1 Tax=Microbacterium protaetiae TaxID=2509458 RepID=A0A4P6EA54_9MICO|nr:DUF2269 family protein [Microbacterium protaetiae]QAY58844.1 DUF2269 family protein [Microbacterium protaetiae]
MDTLMSILHVATAVFIVGPMAIIPMTGLRALRSGSATQVNSLATSTSVFSWLSLLTFVFGFGAMGMAPAQYNLSFATPWILWSIIAYAIAFLLTVFVVVPQMRKAAVQFAASGTEAAGKPAGKPAGYGAIAGSSGIATLLLVVVVVLMIWKP